MISKKLFEFTLDELRIVLRSLDSSPSGSKTELVLRLKEFVENKGEDPETVTFEIEEQEEDVKNERTWVMLEKLLEKMEDQLKMMDKLKRDISQTVDLKVNEKIEPLVQQLKVHEDRFAILEAD